MRMDLPSVKLATPQGKMAKSSHSAKSSTAGRTAAKKCAFECGKTSMDPDCENPDETMKWAYKDGSGQNCWYCERIWMTELAHQYESRSHYQNICRTDKNRLDEHRSRRSDFLERRKKGFKYIAYQRTGANLEIPPFRFSRPSFSC